MPPQSRGLHLAPSTKSAPNLPVLTAIDSGQENASDDSSRPQIEVSGDEDAFPDLNNCSSGEEDGEEDDQHVEPEHDTAFAPSEPVSPSSSSSSDNDVTPNHKSTNPYEIGGYLPTPQSSRPSKQRTFPNEPNLSSHRPRSFLRTQSLYTHAPYPSHSSASTSSLHLPHHLNGSAQSHHAHQPSFAPPFYNRPPTPLPPSPSLTSLLRPPFSASAAPSRPTTPGGSSSDTEPPLSASPNPATGTGTSTSTGAYPPSNTPHNIRPTHLRPSASTPNLPNSSSTSLGLHTLATTAPSNPHTLAPKIPTHEYYGFALYLSASALFLIYIVWSSLPTPFLHALGVWYYPERWWSLAVPAWIVVLLVWIYVALAGWNTEVLTKGVGSLGGVVDRAGVVAVVDGEGRIVRGFKRGGVSMGRGGGMADAKGGSAARRRHKGQARREGGKGSVRGGEGLVDEREGLRLPWRELWSEGTDAVMDVPIGGVCEVLYGESASSSDEGEDVDEDWRLRKKSMGLAGVLDAG